MKLALEDGIGVNMIFHTGTSAGPPSSRVTFSDFHEINATQIYFLKKDEISVHRLGRIGKIFPYDDKYTFYFDPLNHEQEFELRKGFISANSGIRLYDIAEKIINMYLEALNQVFNLPCCVLNRSNWYDLSLPRGGNIEKHDGFQLEMKSDRYDSYDIKPFFIRYDNAVESIGFNELYLNLRMQGLDSQKFSRSCCAYKAGLESYCSVSDNYVTIFGANDHRNLKEIGDAVEITIIDNDNIHEYRTITHDVESFKAVSDRIAAANLPIEVAKSYIYSHLNFNGMGEWRVEKSSLQGFDMDHAKTLCLDSRQAE